jgi:hypothetical protein
MCSSRVSESGHKSGIFHHKPWLWCWHLMAEPFDLSPLFIAWAWTNLFTVVCLDLTAFSSCMLTACVMRIDTLCLESRAQPQSARPGLVDMVSGCGWLHRRHVRLHQSPSCSPRLPSIMLNHTLILSPQTEYLVFISRTLSTTPIHITPPFPFPDVQQDSHRISFRLDHAPCLLLLLSLAGCACVRACVRACVSCM